MSSMVVRATLAVLLLLVAVKADEGKVTFWRSDFTMTCPGEGAWLKKTEKVLYNGTEYTLPYNGTTKGLYHCEYKQGDGYTKIKYYFYVKGKVCSNCFELNAALVAVVIVLDVVGTAFVMLIVYRCTKKKRPAGFTPAPSAPARSGGRAQTSQPSHYEQLNTHTRSQDPYSVVNRMG